MKTRTLAQKLAVSGRVRINRDKCTSASQSVRAGDVLTIALDRMVRVLKVVQPGTRRGPAAEAQLLYQDLSPPLAASTAPGQRLTGSGRPTKRDYRRIAGLAADGSDDFPPDDG